MLLCCRQSTVSGGELNVAGAEAATVAGGRENDAMGSFSTVGGGFSNTVYVALGVKVCPSDTHSCTCHAVLQSCTLRLGRINESGFA
jgi:hypothetical protein